MSEYKFLDAPMIDVKAEHPVACHVCYRIGIPDGQEYKWIENRGGPGQYKNDRGHGVSGWVLCEICDKLSLADIVDENPGLVNTGLDTAPVARHDARAEGNEHHGD